MATLYHNTTRGHAEHILRAGFAPGIVSLAVEPVEVCDSMTWVQVELDSLRGLRREYGDCGLYRATVYEVRASRLNPRIRAMTIITCADIDAASATRGED